MADSAPQTKFVGSKTIARAKPKKRSRTIVGGE